MTGNTDIFSFKNCSYLVTGAASGIGKATSVLLSQLGANLILADINSEGLIATKEECRVSDRTLTIDLSKASLIKEAIQDCINDFGKLNGLIHLAGKPYISPLKSITEEKCAEIYYLNTYAAIELSKVFISNKVYSGERG